MNSQVTTNLENLKQQILDLIECMYSHQLISRLELEVYTLDDDLKAYIVKMYLHDQRWAPLVIAGEFKTDDEFLLYMCEEIRSRNLIRSEHYKIQLYEDNEC